ncbi:MAG: DUF4367 domain-containing protein [Clostridiales bacterium]|nr:DUF4367 domain-containing protein [Clostridiales bacterium]
MQRNLEKEEKIKQEVEQLNRELDDLIDKENLEEKDFARIDEINTRLEEINPLPYKFPKKEVWKKIEDKYPIRDVSITKEVESKKASGHKRVFRRFRPVGIAAVIVVFICVCSNLFVGANKFSGYRTVSNELLTISGSDPEESDIKMFSSIEEIEEYTENDFLLPEYLPAEYVFSYAVYSKTTGHSVISFISEENLDEELIFRIKPLGNEANDDIQEENSEVNVITRNNISYNVFQRDGAVVIEWAYDGYLYELNGNINEEEVEKIIDSII